MNTSPSLRTRLRTHLRLPWGVALATPILCSGILAQDDPQIPDAVLEQAARIVPESVRSTEYFLASDFMAGRDTPSRELEIAAEYLSARFAAAGLLPIDTKTGYRHRFELPGVRAPSERPTGSLQLGSNQLDLDSLTHCAVPFGAPPRGRVVEGELLFIGGPGALLTVDRNEARGRVGVILEGLAVADAELENVSEAFRSSIDPALLARIAPQMSLAALLYVCAPGAQGAASFRRQAELASEPRLSSRGRRATTPLILVHDDALRARITTSLGINGSEAPSTKVELKGRLEAQVPASTAVPVRVANIAGILPGRDPVLRDEYVLVSAHYDHVGRAAARDGDTIANGADDNASGTTAVLHLAEAFSNLETRPRRSLVFVGFAAEEKGLLGSRAWVENPPLPLDKTVAVVNIEMIGRPDDIEQNDSWITGFRYSDMGSTMAAAASRVGIQMRPHAELGDRLFGASDNAPFANVGVVAHSISAGSLHPDYHQVTDEVHKIDFENMTRVMRGIMLGAWAVAESERKPLWNEDDPTGAKYAARR